MENEKSVLITGASGGIGLAIAEAVAKERTIIEILLRSMNSLSVSAPMAGTFVRCSSIFVTVSSARKFLKKISPKMACIMALLRMPVSVPMQHSRQ